MSNGGGGVAGIRPVSMVAGGGAKSASDRPTSLMDRLSKLNHAQNQWQNKVEEKVIILIIKYKKKHLKSIHFHP